MAPIPYINNVQDGRVALFDARTGNIIELFSNNIPLGLIRQRKREIDVLRYSNRRAKS